MSRQRLFLALLTVLLFLLAGCGEKAECSQDEPCPFGSTCQQGQCVSARCATSTQCGMEQHCVEGVCQDGCSDDLDCYPGDVCDPDLVRCEQGGCEDAHRDCAFKEFCNGASGECYEAAGYYCRGCDDDDDCGGEQSGNHCYGGYCLVECTRDSDCPAGFYCYGFVDNAGNVQYYQCYSACELYEGYEGARARRVAPAPADERLLPVDPTASPATVQEASP
jgi:Cys-rich repeat protein